MNTKTSHIQLIVLLSILLCIVSSVYVWGRSYVVKKDVNVAQLNGLIEKQQDMASKVASLRRTEKDTSEDRATLDTHFITEREIVDYLGVLEKTGKERGLSVTIKNVSQITGKKNQPILSAVVQSEGSRSAVIGYLKDLEKLPYLIEFQQTSLSKDFEIAESGAKKEFWILAATIDLYSFVLLEK